MAWCNCYWYHKAHSPGRSRYEEYQLEQKYKPRREARLQKANKRLERSLHDAIQIGV
mgnify:FL=1|jgi:hypothetical protein